ncbi:MFS transporter [Vibrio sp. SCSIO 43136]|uniref:MFS transporter n=1 Tax=Vibrio sp. SCSIO 43136 TaxID=2819101 RepID=UPI002074CF1C|nr:MFS transporter [Vibrio sp. SCSIO 43136]USD67776.1 MFS transporter [Vibrio sp. SCSIO 43136]
MFKKTIPYLSGFFFDGISSGLFMMALPWVMLKQGDMGAFVALVALTCTGLSFVSTPFFATLIDRQSRKKVLIGVQIAQVITAFTVLIMFSFELGNVWMLALAQIIFWVTNNIAWSANSAFTQENYEPHEYAKIASYQELVMQGTTLGAGALGVILLELWGMQQFALFAVVASSLSTLCYLVTPYRRKVRKSKRVPFLKQLSDSKQIFSGKPQFFTFIFLSCLGYPVVTYLGKLVPIWFAENNVPGDFLAAYSMAFGIGSLVTGVFVARLLAAYSQWKLMLGSMFVLSTVLFAMSALLSPIYIVLLTLVFGFFNALNRIARTNLLHHSVAIEERGRIDGGLAMFSTLVQSLSYTLIAFLAHYQLTDYGFIAIAVTVLIATLTMWLVSQRSSKALNLAIET